MQIPLVNESQYIKDADLAFIAEACHDTLADCADKWGQPRQAVVSYGRSMDAPTLAMLQDVGRVASVVDDLSDAPGAEAYHTVTLDGVVLSRILAGFGADVDVVSVGIDHENKEELVDPTCDGEVKMPDGRLLAKEVCDPVQGDVRKVSVTIGSSTRDIAVSNFVYPAYFQEGAPGPYDAFGHVSRPFEILPGGYQEITDPVTGETSYVFADAAAAASLEAKRKNPASRLYRRIAKRAASSKATGKAPPTP